MRVLVDQADYGDAARVLNDLAVKQFPALAGFIQAKPFNENKCRQDILKDVARVHILLDDHDYENHFVKPWVESATKNEYSQGDVAGVTPAFIVRAARAKEREVACYYSYPVNLAYWNDADELCGLTLFPEIYLDANNRCVFVEPVNMLLSIVNNTTAPRFPDGSYDGPRQQVSLLDLNLAQLEPPQLDEIVGRVGSKKLAPWIRLMLSVKNSQHLEGIFFLFGCFQDFSAYERKGMGLCFDIVDIDSVFRLSDEECDALIRAKKALGDKVDVKYKIESDAHSAFFLSCVLNVESISTPLRELCQIKLEKLIFSLSSDGYFKRIFDAYQDKQVDYMKPASESLAPRREQVVFVLRCMIEFCKAAVGQQSDLRDELSDAIAFIVDTIKRLNSGVDAGGVYALVWHKFLATGMLDNGPEALIPGDLWSLSPEGRQFIYEQISRVTGIDPAKATARPSHLVAGCVFADKASRPMVQEREEEVAAAASP
jgi:hypothetical protein